MARKSCNNNLHEHNCLLHIGLKSIAKHDARYHVIGIVGRLFKIGPESMRKYFRTHRAYPRNAWKTVFDALDRLCPLFLHNTSCAADCVAAQSRRKHLWKHNTNCTLAPPRCIRRWKAVFVPHKKSFSLLLNWQKEKATAGKPLRRFCKA